MICPHCKATVADTAKFCKFCGGKLSPSPSEEQNALNNNGLDRVRNKAIWSIADGEIARKISELDFVNLSTISGIIIQPGVSAVIYIDGALIADINSGIYEFVSDAQLEDALNQKGFGAFLKKKARSLSMLLRSISETKGSALAHIDQIQDKKNELEAADQVKKVLNSISSFNEKSIISVYLKRDVNFPTFFGNTRTPEGASVFEPMTIRTRVLDSQVGVHMFMRIASLDAFIRYWMATRTSVTAADVQEELARYVQSITQEVLKSEEIDDFGINSATKDKLYSYLKGIEAYSYGIEVVRLADVTCSNEAFDRFRALTAELYCSEKELDYLRRTGDFKNRLARETNKQAIEQARNEQELRAALTQVNMDDLLSQDELESFTLALATQKFKREQHAAADSAISKMHSQEEVGKVGIGVQTNLTLAQLDADDRIYDKLFALERKKQETSFDLESDLKRRKLQNERENTNIILGSKRDIAAFEDERHDKDFEETKRRLDLALNIDDRMNEQEQSNLDREHQRERESRKDEYTHIETIAGINAAKSPEQLLVEKIDKLDAAAQAVYASSFVSKKEEEIAKAKAQMYEDEKRRLIDEYRAKQEKDGQDKDKLYDFLKEMVHSNAAVAGATIAKEERHAQEYREDARYQQSRVDHTQDKALEYTTKSNGPAKPEEKPTHDSRICFCPHCGRKVRELKGDCPACGENMEA